MRAQTLEDLRERALELVEMRPAEVNPEMTWLVSELERNKEVILGIIDYLLTDDM